MAVVAVVSIAVFATSSHESHESSGGGSTQQSTSEYLRVTFSTGSRRGALLDGEATSGILPAVPGMGPAQHFIDEECTKDESGRLQCGIANPIAAPTGAAQIMFYRNSNAGYQLKLTMKDENATIGTTCSAVAVFEGLKGMTPSTTGQPIASDAPMAFAMQWEAGHSTYLILDGLEPSSAHISFYLHHVSCPMAAMVMQGGRNFRVASLTLPSKASPATMTACPGCTVTSEPEEKVTVIVEDIASPTVGTNVTVLGEHSGGVAHLVKTATSRHYFATYASHSPESPQIYQHVVNLLTHSESIYKVVPNNGTAAKIIHLAGLNPRDPSFQLPQEAIDAMSNAVNGGQRRGVAQDILLDICHAVCPPCVSNALDSLTACYTVASPSGRCWGCGESCATAVSEDGINVFDDGKCVYDGYKCFGDVRGCYESLKTTYNTCTSQGMSEGATFWGHAVDAVHHSIPYWKGAGFSSRIACMETGPIGQCDGPWQGFKWVSCGGSYCRG